MDIFSFLNLFISILSAFLAGSIGFEYQKESGSKMGFWISLAEYEFVTIGMICLLIYKL